jgi:hypothetical protein
VADIEVGQIRAAEITSRKIAGYSARARDATGKHAFDANSHAITRLVARHIPQ